MMQLKRRVLDKRSQLRTIISLLMILAIFSYFFVFAENSTINGPNQITAAVVGIDNQTDLNSDADDTNITKIALPSEPDTAPEGTLTVPPEIARPEIISEPTPEPTTNTETVQNNPGNNFSDNNSAQPTSPILPITTAIPPKIMIKNKQNQEIGAHILIASDSGEYRLELSSLTPGTGLGLSEEGEETKVIINGIKNISADREIIAKVDEYTNNLPDGLEINTKVFAITELEIEEATIRLPKSGKVNTILTCSGFNLDSFTCLKWEPSGIAFQDYGNYIEFKVDHFSAYAGGEIIAIDAEHLNSNQTFISNIYANVNTIDDLWSEPIYEGETVRVTFEEPLTDGRTIDVVARSNGTIAYFEVYEAGTDHIVGRSPVTDQAEHQYMTIEGLSKPTDLFDFRIVKVITPQEEINLCISTCPQRCPAGNEETEDSGKDKSKDNGAEENSNCFSQCEMECDTTSAHPKRTAFLEFDYIHDDAITSTQADGMIAYGELNVAIPRFRTWNESNNFTVEQNALATGVSGTDDITWIVLKGNHERDEMILGTEDKGGDVNIQVYHANKTWDALQEVSIDIPNSALRSFDLAYEDVSGDALIVYETSSVADTSFSYRIWNGTAYSAAQSLTTGLASSVINWVALTPKRGTDEMMLLLHNALNDLHAIPWNGTGFDTARNITLSEGTVSDTDQHFAFAWEDGISTSSGLVTYGEGNNLVYRSYDSTTAPYWSAETAINLGDGLNAIQLCSNPSSEYIGLIWQDTGFDLQAMIWNGSEILTGAPTQDGATEAHGTNNQNMDCAWYNSSSALFGFIDDAALTIDYFNFTKPNTWSVTALTATPTTATFGSNDIEGLHFSLHPTTDEIMIVAQDIAEDVTVIRWNSTGFYGVGESPLETSTEVLNAAQESAMFDWYRYDPVPNVTGISPNSLTYSQNFVILVNATIMDNIKTNTVLANITAPNSSQFQITLINSTGNSTYYNNTFPHTATTGTYTLRIIANDTSVHQNVNSTETATFLIVSTAAPSVTWTAPSNYSNYTKASFNRTFSASIGSLNIEAVKFQFDNATGTDFNQSAVNSSGTWSASINVSGLTEGINTIVVHANTTSGQQNNTQSISIITDYTAPTANWITPTNVSNYTRLSYNQTFNASIKELNFAYAILFSFDNASGTNFNVTAINGSGSWAAQYNLSSLAEGTHTVTIIANDSAGNWNNTQQITFIIDNTAPRAIFITPSNQSRYKTYDIYNITFNASILEENFVQSVLFSFDNASGTNFNITAVNGSGSWAAQYNISSLAEGTHSITIIANDSVGNTNNTQNINLIVDNTPPNVIGVLPFNSSNSGRIFNLSNTIEIAANVTDSASFVSTVFANLSYPNGSTILFALSNGSGYASKYNLSFTVPALLGNYNLTIIANDSLNNYNRTEKTNFSVNDATPPAVSFNYPPAESNFFQNAQVLINITVTDQINVSIVTANVTAPNGSIFELTLTDDQADGTFNNTFVNTGTAGRYNISIFANDTSNNINKTEWRTFNIQDSGTPFVNLLSPPNGMINNTNNITFFCNATDNTALSNITLYHNISGTFTAVETKGVNGTSNTSNFTVNNIADGYYGWNCLAEDTSSNRALAIANFTFTIDTTKPAVTWTAPGDSRNYTLSSSNQTFIASVLELNPGSVLFSFDNASGTNFNITAVNSSGSWSAQYNISSLAEGTHTVTVIANDSAKNVNNTEYLHFITDYTAPTVSWNFPDNRTNYGLSSFNQTFEVNITEANFVQSVLFSFDNASGTNFNITAVNNSGRWTASYNVSSLEEGAQTITAIANDSAGNFNNTQSITITVDKTPPNLTTLLPTNSSNSGRVFNVSNIIEIGANLTDALPISIVSANLSYPNGSAILYALSNGSGYPYKFNLSFTIPKLVGNYNITFFANDSVNNYNATEKVNFTVNDIFAPNITIHAPSNGTNSSSRNLLFNFTASDDLPTAMNCSLYVNGTLNQTNSATNSNEYTTFTVNNFLDGPHSWNLTCLDASSNSNTSDTRIFTIDTIIPTFNSLTFSPSTEAELDPNINLTIFANVTDNITGISTVIVEYKLSTSSDYTNLSPTYNPQTLTFNTSFNATTAGTYNLRVWANDSAGNPAQSNLVNLTVQLDKNWSRTPSTFVASATLNSNVTLGNFTINNTGDFSLNFSITSNSNATTYNQTENFTLASGAVKQITVYENATLAGIKTVTFNISSNDTTAVPYSLTTTGTIAVAPNQPVLIATFTTPSAETLSVTQKDTNVALVAKLENIGEGNASNVTFFIDLPNDWTVTFGQVNQTYSELNSGDNIEISLEVTIPAGASTGLKTVLANATAYNASGTNLQNADGLDLIFSDSIEVTVNAAPASLGAEAAVAAAVSSAGSSETAGGGAGGGGGGGGLEPVLFIEESIVVQRGQVQTSPFVVKNIYENTILTNVKLELEGFISQYVSWTPQVLKDIAFGENKEFEMTIFVPSYFTEAEYELTATITGELVSLDPKVTKYTQKSITEKRKLILKVIEVSEEDLSSEIKSAEECIREMKLSQFPASKVGHLMAEALDLIKDKEYKKAKNKLDEVCAVKSDAFEAYGLIVDLEKRIEEAQDKGLKIPEALDELELSRIAFNREDFALAIDRAKNAQLTYVLETKGKVNIVNFAQRYWGAILLGLAGFSIIIFFGYQRFRWLLHRSWIKSLNKEEEIIHILIKESQKDYLTKHKVSENQYQRYLKQYRERLSAIKQQRIKLRSIKWSILNPRQELEDLLKEKEKLRSALKQNQNQYFISGKAGHDEFNIASRSLRERLAEVEQEENTLRVRIKAKKK